MKSIDCRTLVHEENTEQLKDARLKVRLLDRLPRPARHQAGGHNLGGGGGAALRIRQVDTKGSMS